MPISLTSPKSGAVVRQPSTHFVWEPEASPVEDYVLEVATDSGFSNLISRVPTPAYDIDVNIVAGNYYWRVTYLSDNPSGQPFTVAGISPSTELNHAEDGISRLLTQFKESE